MQIHEWLHTNLWHVLHQISVNSISLFKVFHGISDFILRRLKIERLFQAPTVHLAKTHAPILRCSRKRRHPQKAYASMLVRASFTSSCILPCQKISFRSWSNSKILGEKKQQPHLGQAQLLTPYALTMHKST